MPKPKGVPESFAEYERKRAVRERAEKRAALGKLEPERISGDHERRYQEQLEARGQLTIFDAINRAGV